MMPEDTEAEALKRRISLYRKILDRYKDIIEKSESKTLAEMKGLIDPENPSIRSLRERIASEFRPYIFEKDFEKAAQKAFEFMRDEVANEQMPIDFWLSSQDVLELRAADEMDKSVFLCSLLASLENDSARVAVASDHKAHSFVIFEWKGSFHLFDPVHDVRMSGEKDLVLEEHRKKFGWKKIEYEFNSRSYQEFE